MRKVLLKSIFAVGASGIMLLAQTAPPGQTAASTDSEMTSKVHQALMSDPTVGAAAQHIRVTTKNGVVTLKGRVSTAAEKDEAVAKAKQIAGDQNVKDELTASKK
ncbi:MAG TPA: BON domain-containing protein [Bryobacteraceae bacterium]|jgi:osmotically-inducible protein OsmY|nr:BON domain-containing protein [Bryobacteraceae bacterium]